MVAQPLRPDARALLAVTPSSRYGGSEVALFRLLDECRAAGWNIAVAAPGAGELAKQLRERDYVHVAIPELNLAAGGRLRALVLTGLRHARTAWTLRRARIPVDLVYGNGVIVLPVLRLARFRAPVVWQCSDVIARSDWRRMLRACSASVDVAVAPSDAAAAPLRAVGLDTRVVRNGVEWPVEGVTDPPNELVVGLVGALTPLKGQDVLLAAAAALPRVVVELVGSAPPKDDEYEAQLHALADTTAVRGRVRFLGQVKDVLGVLRRWRVAVSASVVPESGGLSVLEAMSVGVPVVATAHGGPAEVLGDAGLLVPPGDTRALVEAIGRLCDDDGAWRDCSAAGPRAVGEHHTLPRYRAEMMSVFERALELSAR